MAILQPGATVFADMTLIKGIQHAADEPTKQVIYSLARRVAAVKPHQDRLRDWCDRADRLYYAEDITQGGADLWATTSAKITGRIARLRQPPARLRGRARRVAGGRAHREHARHRHDRGGPHRGRRA
jgi:hypothetical protein